MVDKMKSSTLGEHDEKSVNLKFSEKGFPDDKACLFFCVCNNQQMA